MDEKFTATDLLIKSPEVLKHLTDDLSKQIYDFRLKHLLIRDKNMLRDDITKLIQEQCNSSKAKKSKIDLVYEANAPIESIIIFGSGDDGKLVLRLLKQTKYKDQQILFCDNDEKKLNKTIKGLQVISPQELLKRHKNSLIIIASRKYNTEIYSQLMEMKYPASRIIEGIKGGGYQYLLGLGHLWEIPKLDDKYNNYDGTREIVLAGAGIYNKHVLNVLKQSIYKDLNFFFCKYESQDNEIPEGVQIISPQELVEKHLDSIVIIPNPSKYDKNTDDRYKYDKNTNVYYQKLIKSGYPPERIMFTTLKLARTGWQYFDYFEPRENEIFVDAGCYNGNTAVAFIQWATKGYDNIFSFEADSRVLENCRETFKNYQIKGQLINKGLWYKTDNIFFDPQDIGSSKIVSNNSLIKIETVSLDDFLQGKKVTFIKIDIEGAEFKALLGAEKTIRKWRPRLAISIYHKPEDILEIPVLLLEMQPDYKFALRQYAAHGTETILYAY